MRLEDTSENVQNDKRVGMARSQLRFMTSEPFALQFFSLAARGGAAAALQTSTGKCQASCVVTAVCKLPYTVCIYIYDYICISPYININRTAFVGCRLQPGNGWEQYGGPADVILSFSMRLYRYIYTIAIYRPHLQEFTGKI